MGHQTRLSDLEAFAKEQIAADRYPEDDHFFRLLVCDTCGVIPFEITIEHHTGSTEGDFRGVIWGECAACGCRTRLFGFTGAHRKRLREDEQVCACGSTTFLVGECERIEGEQGLAGFFDGGVVVGKCARCGRKRAFVHTD
jgi:hypothetical protein